MKSDDLSIHSLKAISPIDGRHHIMTKPLGEWFSEYALFKYRSHVEVEYLIALSELEGFDAVRTFTKEEKDYLRSIIKEFSLEDAKIIQDIDRFGYNGAGPTNHDVKSVEYFIKMKLKGSSLEDVTEMVHFGLTSEDINNIAFDCMIHGALQQHYIPSLVELLDRLAEHAQRERNTAMLSKTHGQPATPTTFGKEMANYLERLRIELINMASMRLPAKLNGAVGNHNAQHFAAPEVDWIGFAERFTTKMGFSPNLMTTQIEPHDGLARLFNTFISINNILRDLSVDFWLYISAGYMVQRKVAHEVGSSTMPHKINPWRLEVAEGSTVEANFKLMGFVNKLQSSRLQRDCSDHEAQRAIGVGISHSYLAVIHLIEELQRLQVNPARMIAELKDMGMILTEAVQTLLRKEGHDKPYELMKELSRGQQVTVADLHAFISRLDIDTRTKEKILALRPETYIGVAPRLVDIALCKWKEFKSKYKPPRPEVKKVILDCNALTAGIATELPALASTLRQRGLELVGIDIPEKARAVFTGSINREQLSSEKHAIFIGAMDELFNKARDSGMICVNLEDVSRKKSEYNIFRLSEVTGILDSLE
ncbi:MAG: adenylosuccinate lyase [Candidatus Woesearchaeota archaeon]